MNNININQQLAQLTQLMQAGLLAEVERRATTLLEQTPGDARLLCLLGRVQRLQGKRESARKNLQAAHQLAPRAAQVLSELGYLSLAEESYASAEKYFGELVRVHPGFTDAWFNLGVTLRQQGRHPEAIAALERCLASGGGSHEQVHTELGTAYIMQRNETAAQEHFEKALALDPDYCPALHGVGMVKSAFGEFDEAADYFRKAMRSNPDFVEAYQQLVSIRRFDGIDDPDVVTMEQIVSDPARHELTRETLHYALGKVYDDCGAYEQAFDHYEQANKLKKNGLPAFSKTRLSNLIDELIDTFDGTLQFPCSNDSELPLLVFGMPRSGTTLVEQVLASHSAVDAGGEQSYVERATRSLLAPYPGSLKHIDATKLAQFAAGYLQQLGTCRGEGTHVTDKMPANFFHVGLVHQMFPRARLVYCRRNRLDNALSIYFQSMPTGHHYANDLDEIDFYYSEHERLMRHYTALLGEHLLTVDYEDMVGDFDTGTRRLIEFCGLPWEEQCLDYSARKGPVATLSLWQVRQPIYSRSVQRWKHYAKHLPAHLIDRQ